jgi:peptidoglycan/LPS O-acetylase OafA/YrhL
VLNKTHHYRFILLGTLVAFLLLAYVSGKTLIDWTVQGGLYRIGLEFVLGAALYNLLRTQAIPGWITQGLFIMGLAGCWLVPAAEVRDLCAIVSLGCLISSLAQLKGWGLRLLSVRPMVYLGEISYSIYMVHLLCLQLFQATIYKVVSTDMKPYVLILLLICIYVLSALIFRFVEVPCRRKIRTIGLGYLGNASPAKAQL